MMLDGKILLKKMTFLLLGLFLMVIFHDAVPHIHHSHDTVVTSPDKTAEVHHHHHHSSDHHSHQKKKEKKKSGKEYSLFSSLVEGHTHNVEHNEDFHYTKREVEQAQKSKKGNKEIVFSDSIEWLSLTQRIVTEGYYCTALSPPEREINTVRGPPFLS